MNYYQITADIEDFGEEEEEDDPNWLLTSTYSSHRQQPTLKSTSSSTKSHSTEKLNGDSHSTPNKSTPTSNGSLKSRSNGDQNGGFDEDYLSTSNGVENNQNSTLNQVVAQQNQSEVKVVLRRPRNQNNVVGNNVKEGGNNRSSYYRFSRLIEGVASYVSARPLHEEDGSFHNNEQNGSVSETSQANVRHNDVSPSSTDSGFASLNGGNVDNRRRNVEVDPIDEKITELFKSLESVPVSEDFRVVRRRRSQHIPESEESKNNRSFFQRRKQTVSGYFSDWAKWMTNVEPEFERYERYPG